MEDSKQSHNRKEPGAPPGTLLHVGARKIKQVRLRMIDYDDQRLDEREVGQVAELSTRRSSPTVTWINVDGLHETELMGELGTIFDLHPLTLEDILNTHQRPKMESHEKYIFVVLKMLSCAKESTEILSEQVSFILGPGYVLSFQEKLGDVFEPVRQRIRSHKGRIRARGADYLLYALVDAVIDNYFVVLEKIEEQLEVLGEAVFENPSETILAEIQRLKLELVRMRKAVWPLRETISGLVREESELIEERTEIFLKDVYDHTIQAIDTVEGFRDTVSGLLDIYLSNVSNRMNEVMKVLTIIATIFIPLTFIAGIYGMNFDVMPELRIPWAYPTVWLIMLTVAGLMLRYFKKRNWL